MKAFSFFVFYFCAASAVAALIAFPLYESIGNDEFGFERWVSRSALLLLILGLFPCLKFFNLSFASLGYNANYSRVFKQLAIGFTAGLCILGAVIAVLIFLEIRVISADSQISSSLLLNALIAGLVIALIEESLFRGLFFKLAELWHNSLMAVFLSSFFYALLHFIKPMEHIDQHALSFFSGFEVIINAFAGLCSMRFDDFLALFVVGILLALVRLKTQSLIYCIGLHASWVFLIKTSKSLTDYNASSHWSFLSGQYDGVIGLLVFVWLSLVCTAFFFFIIKRPAISID
jgi:hypothetical protein